MSLNIGDRLALYDVTALIGEGGWGRSGKPDQRYQAELNQISLSFVQSNEGESHELASWRLCALWLCGRDLLPDADLLALKRTCQMSQA